MKIIDSLFQMAHQSRLEVEYRQTCLFDLIAALQEEVYPSEDWIVADIILHLFETGQIKFLPVNKVMFFNLVGYRHLLNQKKKKVNL